MYVFCPASQYILLGIIILQPHTGITGMMELIIVIPTKKLISLTGIMAQDMVYLQEIYLYQPFLPAKGGCHERLCKYDL